jgi:2-polyprenyl-6-hydroxyphenyl methylase/3-demethylubiquinone-9 3-methyltransferase
MTTNQQAELALFSSLAHEWWDLQGPMKPLHLLNPLRLAFIEKYLRLTGQSILDCGCGAGILSEAMAQKGARVVGLDLAHDVIAVAKEHAKDSHLSIEYRCESIQAIASARPESFDAITCMELLEHVEDPVELLKSCFEALKPGGYLFLSTINRTASAFLKTIIGAEYLLGWLPKGTHHYRQFIKPSELATWLRKARFVVGDRQGIFVGLDDHYKFSDDVSVNYLMVARKFV